MKQIQFSTAHFFRSRVLFWCKTSHSLLCLPKTQHRKHASSHINAMLRRRRRSWRNTRSWPILWLPTCLKAMRSHDCHIGTWHQQNKILISNHQKYVKVCESSITPIFVVDTPMVSVRLWWDRMHFEDAEGQTHVGWACSRSSCASRTYQQKPTALSFWTKGVFFSKSQKPRWNWKISHLLLVLRIFYNKPCDGDSSVKLTQLPRVKKKGIRSIQQKRGGISPNPSKILTSEKHSRNHPHSETKNNMNTFQKLITSPITSKTRCNLQFLFMLCRYISSSSSNIFSCHGTELSFLIQEPIHIEADGPSLVRSAASAPSAPLSAARDTIGILWVILVIKECMFSIFKEPQPGTWYTFSFWIINCIKFGG